MAKSNLRLVPSDSELRTVALRRRSNRDMGRDREHLTELEVERLIKVARGNRWGQRDAAMILIGRAGFRRRDVLKATVAEANNTAALEEIGDGSRVDQA